MVWIPLAPWNRRQQWTWELAAKAAAPNGTTTTALTPIRSYKYLNIPYRCWIRLSNRSWIRLLLSPKRMTYMRCTNTGPNQARIRPVGTNLDHRWCRWRRRAHRRISMPNEMRPRVMIKWTKQILSQRGWAYSVLAITNYKSMRNIWISFSKSKQINWIYKNTKPKKENRNPNYLSRPKVRKLWVT